MTGPLLLAHRGDHRAAPENSLAAFRAAVVAGCHGIELDVRRSRDGVAVVLHDASLDRVQGVPLAVARLTAAELSVHGVSTLEAALTMIPASFLADIEIKEAEAVEPAIAAVEAVRGSSASSVVLSSFDRHALERLAGLRPGWPRWLIASNPDAVAAAGALGCAAAALRVDTIDKRVVGTAHGRGLLVVAWTIRDLVTRERMAELGVDLACVEGDALDR